MFVGIVGKANVGKSTFFKAATLAEVEIANYPFATIKPNHAVGYVRVECVDKEFNRQCNPRFGYCLNHIRFVPIDMVDVAGLVPGAHMGLGMGNQFLDDLRQADVLIHVVDVSGSTNEKGEPIQPLSYDPVNDVKFLEEEIDLWYAGILKKGWDKFARQVQQEKSKLCQALSKQLSGLKVTEAMVDAGINKFGLNPEKPAAWTEDQLFELAKEFRKTTKPMIIAANKIDVPGADKNLQRIKELFKDIIIIPCSAESELALREAAKHGLIKYAPGDDKFEIVAKDKLNTNQLNALNFVNENIIKKYGNTGVQQALDEAVFKLLKCVAIFPGGVNKLEDSEGRVLPDCFLMPENTTALDFAFKLHSDFGKNFIRAINVKTKMAVGKDYKLKNRDVVEIVAGR